MNFEKSGGLIPVVVQDDESGEILMLAYTNEQAWRETVDTGFATFWSRSRNALWRKGETSGHRLAVLSAWTDCDMDALVLRVRAIGPGVCHTGYRSCFYRRLDGAEWQIQGEPAFDPKEVYA